MRFPFYSEKGLTKIKDKGVIYSSHYPLNANVKNKRKDRGTQATNSSQQVSTSLFSSPTNYSCNDVFPSSFWTHQFSQQSQKRFPKALSKFTPWLSPGDASGCTPRYSAGTPIFGKQGGNGSFSSYPATQSQGLFRCWQHHSQGYSKHGKTWRKNKSTLMLLSFCLLGSPTSGYPSFQQDLDLGLTHLKCQPMMTSGAHQEDLKLKRKV